MSGNEQEETDRPDVLTTPAAGVSRGRVEAIQSAVESVENLHRSVVDSGIAENVIEAVGDLPGKWDTPVSLSTHILDTTLLGLSVYAYEQHVRDDTTPDPERAALLTAGLLLHDTNKVVSGLYGEDVARNSPAAFERYAEDDPFGIVGTLIERDDVEVVRYLAQQAESTEQVDEVDGDLSRVRGLGRYVWIGDTLASQLVRGDLQEAIDFLGDQFAADETTHVQFLPTRSVEQPILGEAIRATTKELVRGRTPPGVSDADIPVPDEGAYGVVLGSAPEGILYLGIDLSTERLAEACAAHVPTVVMDEFDEGFTPKANWQAFEYDILEEVGLDFEVKRDLIADAYVEVLEAGQGGYEPFESVDDEFRRYLPELIRALFVEKKSSFENEAFQRLYDQTREDVGGQKVKIYTVANALRAFPEHEAGLREIRAEQHPKLREDLQTEESAIPSVVDRLFGTGPLTRELPSGDEACFLCGAPASREYKKGQSAIFGTNAFSKRVGVEQTYKRICGPCNLEYELLSHLAETSENAYTSGDLNVAYLYASTFVTDLGIERERGTAVSGATVDFGDPRPQLDSFVTQYRVVPFNLDSRTDATENVRLRTIRQLLETIQSTGLRASIDKPFRPFRPQAAVFADAESTRRQTALGLATIEDYDDLERATRLLDILAKGYGYDVNDPYLALDTDSVPALAHLAYTTYGRRSPDDDITAYLTRYHREQFMRMQTVAERGRDLFGTYYPSRNSKHQRTKIFRVAVEALLSKLGDADTDDRERLTEHVVGQVYNAAIQEEFGTPSTEKAEAFVEALVAYLDEDDLLDAQALANQQHVLTNTYLYAYDTVLQDSEDDSDTEEAEA